MDGINSLFNATATAKRTVPVTAAAAILGGALLLSTGHGNATDRAIEGDLQIAAKSFRCITQMTRVRHFYLDNLRGHLDATLAAANSPTGAVYPPDDMVDAALVGLDRGELVTIPGLHDGDEWAGFEGQRRALAKQFGNSLPAPRYRVGVPASSAA